MGSGRCVQRLQLVAYGLGLLCLGLLLGRLLSLFADHRAAPVIVVEDGGKPGVPVVEVEGVREGRLRGTVGTGARLVVAGNPVVPGRGGSFAVDPGWLLRDVREVLVPDGAMFVASKRGSKYYPVLSNVAGRLAPQNRIYFRTSGEAEAAGYRR